MDFKEILGEHVSEQRTNGKILKHFQIFVCFFVCSQDIIFGFQ